MRYRVLFVLVILSSIILPVSSMAQDEEGYNKPEESASDTVAKNKTANVTVPPGMELRKIGSLNLVVPEGAQMRKEKSQWIMEGPEDFAARSISEIKARLDGIEKEQKELKESISSLKDSIKESQEKAKAPQAVDGGAK